jgi:hypothetical protein
MLSRLFSFVALICRIRSRTRSLLRRRSRSLLLPLTKYVPSLLRPARALSLIPALLPTQSILASPSSDSQPKSTKKNLKDVTEVRRLPSFRFSLVHRIRNETSFAHRPLIMLNDVEDHFPSPERLRQLQGHRANGADARQTSRRARPVVKGIVSFPFPTLPYSLASPFLSLSRVLE